MRILVAGSEGGELASHSSMFTIYGGVDTVHTLLDAVVAYASSCSRGCVYDFVVMHQPQADVTDGCAVIEALRKYESSSRKSGRRTMIYYMSDDDSCQQTYENRNGHDDLVRFQRSPVNLYELKRIAENLSVAVEMQNRRDAGRAGRPLSVKA